MHLSCMTTILKGEFMQSSQVIYQASQDVFFHDVINNRVAEIMEKEAVNLGLSPSKSEKLSWNANAPKIKELLMLSDVQDTYIVFEYLLPRRLQRIDCMIYGKDSFNRDNVIHIELKQWSNNTVHSTSTAGNFSVEENSLSALTGGAFQTVVHPSQQVRGYHGYLTHFIDIISTEQLGLTGVAYCYNYLRKTNNALTDLFDAQFNQLQNEFRTYAKDEIRELADKIHDILCNGDGFNIFNKMINSPIKESQKLLDSIGGMFEGVAKSRFNLLDEQIAAKNAIFDKIRNLKNSSKKSIIVVHGGPGTGKTVIALDILSSLAKSHYQIHYATKSASLVSAIHYQLPNRHAAKKVITGLTEFNPLRCNPDELDVLLIDEAHRIEGYYYSGFGRNKRKISDTPQIDSLLRVTKVLVVFIDDKQAIRSSEIGSSQMMEDCARRCNADIEHIHLYTQFRCNGSDNYLDWLDQVIYNENVTSHFSSADYDLRFLDSPQEVYDLLSVKQSQENVTARLMAGFCCPWSDCLDKEGRPINDVQIGDFAMPWETHRNINKVPEGYVKWYEWAYRPEGFKQIGCIYTAQGFEFDYAGVILGPDIRYDEQNDCLKTDITASKDPMLNKKPDSFDLYVRNIYRVLMSRGMKGTFVYCCDTKVKDYLKKLL